jgi:hypothetical protein
LRCLASRVCLLRCAALRAGIQHVPVSPDLDAAGRQAVLSLGAPFPRRLFLICSRFLTNTLHPGLAPTGTVSLLLAHAAPGISTCERHRQNYHTP